LERIPTNQTLDIEVREAIEFGYWQALFTKW
jgi:hypothetical protein